MSFPNKEDRQRCWGARDKYWECLDKAGDNNKNPCADFRKIYENSCSTQWVKHFDRKRNYLQFKSKIENEGYEPFDEYNRSTNSDISNPKAQDCKFQKRRVYHEIVGT